MTETSEVPGRPVPLTAFEQRFGHPPGLVVLFFSEMWERFSYYGMRALLRLYMTNYLFVALREARQGCWNDPSPCGNTPGNPSDVWFWDSIQTLLPNHPGEAASLMYGTYTALVYGTPFFGGLIADRFWGQRKTVIVGALLMAAGHFLMAIESTFFVALLLLILGNGAFKPNISTQVGSLYPKGDPRRDGAFTIFYMGINLGALLAGLVCGALAAGFGWHYGFGAAGVGMLLGLFVYLWGQKYLAHDHFSRPKTVAKVDKTPLDKDERRRVGALVALCALNVVFWAVYEQQGNTMQAWADDHTSWPVLFGWQVPSTWYQSLNPFLIILLAPLLDIMWRNQARSGKEPTSVTKMGIGCIILGSSFIVMIAGAMVVGDGKGNLFWPVACVVLLTIGELYLSPIGLSLVTKVSPIRIVSMMMGIWFLSSFLGNFLSGVIGILYERWPREGFFAFLTVLGILSGLLMLAFNRPLRRALQTQTKDANA